MQNRRSAAIVLAIAAPLAFVTAACGTKAETPEGAGSPTASPTPASPKDALLASMKPLTTTTFKAKATFSDGIGEATIDPVAKAGTLRTTFAAGSASLVGEQITVGGAAFVKIAFKNFPNAPKLPAGWMTIDLAKIKDRTDYDLSDPDPAELANELLKGLVAVERSGDRGFKGTLDLTKGKEAGIADKDIIDALKDKASAVPFEATVDDKGRIALFKIVVPAAGSVKAQTWDVRYSDWGAAVSVTKPASAVPAPQVFYDFFEA